MSIKANFGLSALLRIICFILLFTIYVSVAGVAAHVPTHLLGFYNTGDTLSETLSLPGIFLITIMILLLGVPTSIPMYGLPLLAIFLAFFIKERKVAVSIKNIYLSVIIIIIVVLFIHSHVIIPNQDPIKELLNPTLVGKAYEGKVDIRFFKHFQIIFLPKNLDESIGLFFWVFGQLAFFSWFVPLWHYKFRDWFWGSKPGIEQSDY